MARNNDIGMKKFGQNRPVDRKSSREGMKRIFTFIGNQKVRFSFGFVILILISILQLLVPKIMGQAIDYLNSGNIFPQETFKYILILMAVSLGAFVMHYLSRQLIMRSANLYSHLERNRIFNKILDLSMNFFSKRSIGEIMALTTNDAEATRHMLGRGFTTFVSMLVLMFSSLILIYSSINPKMALLILVPMPFMILIMSKFGILINKRFRYVQETFSKLTQKAQENITGIRVIKSFTQENNEVNNFETLNHENYIANMSLVKLQALFNPLVSTIMDVGLFLVLIFGGKMALEGTISLGDFIALNSYVGIIMRPLRMIGTLITLIQRGKASLGRISELLNETPDIFDGKFSKENITNIDTLDFNSIEFNDLTFSYDKKSKAVLADISFKLEKGKTLGIVGRVGSGKSTIAALLSRLYDTNKRGEILIDGTDIGSIPLKVLRDKISYVPQNSSLFSDTIANNIDFSPNKHSISQIEEAAKNAEVHDCISEFKDGYSSIVGERGVNLSGGQKQRISIARALIKDSPILILDDCLSAVDTKTESRIIEKLKATRKNRACIIVAHRLSALKDADEIIVLDEGHIVERGTHDSLLTVGGLYQRIYERQMIENKLENE